MKPVADTGPLVGFLDASDPFHTCAAGCFGELRTALTTGEAVIADTEYLAPGAGPLLLELVRRGTLRIVPLLPAEAETIGVMLQRYPKMQFADACGVRLSETIADAVVYTTDKQDFSVYRRHRNQAIKTVTP